MMPSHGPPAVWDDHGVLELHWNHIVRCHLVLRSDHSQETADPLDRVPRRPQFGERCLKVRLFRDVGDEHQSCFSSESNLLHRSNGDRMRASKAAATAASTPGRSATSRVT